MKELRLKVTFICSRKNKDSIACTPMGKHSEYFKHWDSIKAYILEKYIDDIICDIFDIEPCEFTS